MIKKLLNRKKIILVVVLMVGIFATATLVFNIFKSTEVRSNESEFFKPQSSQIMAAGSIASQNQESLHFQIGGKLVFLPFKEGDQVFEGQVIASIDGLEAQKNVTAAQANYRSAQAALNLVLDNIHLFQYGNGGFANVGSASETQTQKTQRQQAEEAVNVAFDNLQKTQKQLENTTLIAPFDGTIVHEDVKDTGINITPTTTFVLANLNKLVFQAQVSDSNIGEVNVGDIAQIKLDSLPGQKFSGTVSKIYPEKIKLLGGGEGYKVDIGSDQIVNGSYFGANGSVLFDKKMISGLLVPSWTVLGNQYIWVMDQNMPKLKKVEVGETFGDKTQILQGLSSQDKVILDPKIIIKKDYLII